MPDNFELAEPDLSDFLREEEELHSYSILDLPTGNHFPVRRTIVRRDAKTGITIFSRDIFTVEADGKVVAFADNIEDTIAKAKELGRSPSLGTSLKTGDGDDDQANRPQRRRRVPSGGPPR